MNPESVRGRFKHTGRARAAGVLVGLAMLPVALDARAQSEPPVPGVAPEVSRPDDPLAAAFAPVPGGLTPRSVARGALRNSDAARLRRSELRAAEARVDLALIAYFPRATLSASYTRLSENENIVGTQPCPDDPTLQCQYAAGDDRGGFIPPTRAPLVPDVFVLGATVLVPISDYVLRIPHAHASARNAAEAARLESAAAEDRVVEESSVALYAWMRARGQLVVAREAVRLARAHVEDAKELAAVGRASATDQLRFDAQLAAAERLIEDTASFHALAEEELRRLAGLPAGQLGIGVDLERPESNPPPVATDVALRRRNEIRAAEATERSLEADIAHARADYFPRVEGFADLAYSNPNHRFQPLRDEWNGNWAVGLRATWIVNETVAAGAMVSLAEARAEAARARRGSVRETITREVEQAAADARRQRGAQASAERGVVAAERLLTSFEELYKVGRASASDLVDAQTELTRARLVRLDARIGLLTAEARLARTSGAP